MNEDNCLASNVTPTYNHNSQPSNGLSALLLKVCVGIALATVIVSTECLAADTFVISDSGSVEDVAMRDREYSEWNFGAGHFLEAGFMPGLYEIHHAASLIRFNLSGLGCRKVVSAKLRLYKPKDYIQMAPVSIQVRPVGAADGAWIEGSSECAAEAPAATWKWRGNNRPWSQGEGCGIEEIDGLSPAFDTRIAPDGRRGQWLEFDIPAGLVQSWLDSPADNAGLLIGANTEITIVPDAAVNIHANVDVGLGSHVFFYSSEHHSGKGPQLVIRGVAGKAPSKRIERPYNPREQWAPVDAPEYERWLASKPGRYTNWATDGEMGLSREQGLLPYYWTVITRGGILCEQSRIPLMKNLDRLDEAIEKGDEAEAKAALQQARGYLLVWEYVRQTRWYDTGPIAEILSPRQIAVLWGKPGYGIFARMDPDHWQVESKEKAILKAIGKLTEDMELTPEKTRAITPLIREHEGLECDYRIKIGQSLRDIATLLAEGNDSTEIFDAVRRLHFSHEMFLYHQSTYNTPRFSALIEIAPSIPFARTYLRVRRNEYNESRIMGQYEEALTFYWRPKKN
ncbi:MAG: DNRLRE domain-containing protein [Planctomycetes bacterium]|nr:DNRLRE domain-containing protein [Planctomycetota bacterium]